jgi:microcystin-dependent protein
MADQFVGEIRAVGFNFPPKGWAFCDGQLLPISQNTALFSLLGTFYGGDGKSTFALPDLRGAVPVGQGQGDPAELQAPAPARAFARSTAGFAYLPAAPNVALNPQVAAVAGGSLPHNNMQPSLVMNFVIALQGIFPQRQ